MLETSTTLETSTINADDRRRSPTSIVDIVDSPALMEDSTGPFIRSLKDSFHFIIFQIFLSGRDNVGNLEVNLVI
jgi:hypothetical protein